MTLLKSLDPLDMRLTSWMARHGVTNLVLVSAAIVIGETLRGGQLHAGYVGSPERNRA
jgi:hypothetical protein